MKITVRDCRSCGRKMVAASVYLKGVVSRHLYVTHAARGLCGACYTRVRRYGPTVDGVAPPSRKGHNIQDGQPCRDCGRPMINGHQYQRYHVQYKALGHVRHGGHGMCPACYRWASLHGTLPDPAPRDDTRRRSTRKSTRDSSRNTPPRHRSGASWSTRTPGR